MINLKILIHFSRAKLKKSINPFFILYAMTSYKPLVLLTFLFALLSSSCITKQTTTSDGAVVDEKYIVKRPLKKFIQTVEFE